MGLLIQEMPVRTVWDACRDMFEDARRRRCADTWDRAYRLWVQASISRAPGVPFMLTTYKPVWLP